MLNKDLNIFLFILFAFNMDSLKANTIFDSCPKNINTDQNLKNEIEKWNFLNEDTNYILESIRISEDHPSKKYWLLPDNHKNNNYIWNVNQSKIDYWLTCSYSNTSIILTKKIDKKYQRCIVDINKKEYICN